MRGGGGVSSAAVVGGDGAGGVWRAPGQRGGRNGGQSGRAGLVRGAEEVAGRLKPLFD